MNKLFYRLVIFVLIFSVGIGVFLSYKDVVYDNVYEMDYVEGEESGEAVNDANWLDPVEIKKAGYYIVKIEPKQNSLDNQTYHILELLDQDKNVITRLEGLLYEEVGEVSEGSPENLRNCKWDTSCKNQIYADYTRRKLVKINKAGKYLLWYAGVKDISDLKSEDVNFSIYKKINPYLVGSLTLLLAILGGIFFPKFLRLETILKVLKKK